MQWLDIHSLRDIEPSKNCIDIWLIWAAEKYSLIIQALKMDLYTQKTNSLDFKSMWNVTQQK